MLTAIKGFSLEGVDHSEAMVPVAGRGGFCTQLSVHQLCCIMENISDVFFYNAI